LAAFGLAFALVGIAPSRAARAQESPEGERLFREGRERLDAGDLEGACAKFDESQRVEPAAGTLLNLGDCYERRGMLATAWRTFKEAAVAAAFRSRHDWERLALLRIDALAKRLPVLVVRVPEASQTPGLAVERDQRTLPDAELGRPQYVDPGRHEISASAPGRASWQTSVAIAPAGSATVDVPVLPPAGAAANGLGLGSGAPSTSRDAPRPWQKPAGIAAAGVGGAAIVFGVVAGGLALGSYATAKDGCASYPTRCTPDGTAANDRAKGWATVSTVSVVVGAAVLLVGIAAVLTAPHASAPAEARVTPAR